MHCGNQLMKNIVFIYLLLVPSNNNGEIQPKGQLKGKMGMGHPEQIIFSPARALVAFYYLTAAGLSSAVLVHVTHFPTATTGYKIVDDQRI